MTRGSEKHSGTAAERPARGPSHFRMTDVRRLVKAVEAAGLRVGRIIIDGERIEVVSAGPEQAPVDEDTLTL